MISGIPGIGCNFNGNSNRDASNMLDQKCDDNDDVNIIVLKSTASNSISKRT